MLKSHPNLMELLVSSKTHRSVVTFGPHIEIPKSLSCKVFDFVLGELIYVELGVRRLTKKFMQV